ncbi:hypothetical protein SDRG_04732 [Saprolegnia diclina VS20]|uniref:WDR19 first beta-propeller domain-containing protein n=1 Tax=Saprolegnia diclina (strain VS20) TaxID=1156394 RepID=T0QI75_SAPDV|nr:hypothetical protein SDRG_04732 [Saprolegnia diclina VS20]EQC37704.1 hypothetical protein SDRG_04732 [Saprolegnia diclina VS20]|eukprot:XP_008608637.1 hypothetical protein SDRG_04732 [Saprolegnia diclina VS20]
MHVFFSVDQRHHGVGPVKYAWDPSGSFLASTGTSRVVHIFNRLGELVDQVVPPSPSMCTHLEWSQPSRDAKAASLVLAIAQANATSVLLWAAATQTTATVDVGVKEITLLKWNKLAPTSQAESAHEPDEPLLAIGTSRGHVFLYDAISGLRAAASKHKRKILCGDWNSQREFAFGSEDRQITICDKDGATLDQVKIKAPPISIQFGGRGHVKHILSVNMGGQTILLYDLLEKDNALELAFQARYGRIVNYKWFGNGYIIAGFSSGYVVIISTHLNEIGQEQYCAKFHDDHLHAICYNETNGMVATCGDTCIKVVRMADWKEIAVEDLDRDATQFDDLNWTCDGRVLSVSCHNGWLHHFKLVHMEQSLHQALLEDPASLLSTTGLVTASLRPFTPTVLLLTTLALVVLVLFCMATIMHVDMKVLLYAMAGWTPLL